MGEDKRRRGSGRKKPEGEGLTGAERRRFERIFVDLEVDYRCEDTFLFAYIRDISAMGIFIRTLNPEPPGRHLNLRFSPPGRNSPLELEGVVIWINPYRPGDRENLNPGMGIQFVNLTMDQREELTELVRTFAYLGDDGDEDEDADADAADDDDDSDGDGSELAEDESDGEEMDEDADDDDPAGTRAARKDLPRA